MLSSSTQDDLSNRFRRPDHVTIEDIYDAYGSKLFGIVLNIVRSRDLAEHVLQDTFVKVWRNSASYDKSKGRLFTWLLNIARNSAIDATRTTHYKHCAKMENLDELVHQHSPHTLNTDCMDVRNMTSQLDEKYRNLIELVYFQGYTQREAAEATGIPVNTIKTRLRRSLLEMRALYARDWTDNSGTLR